MERVCFFEHQGTRIMQVDYSGVADPDELHGIVRAATALLRTQEPHSVVVLVDITGVPHSLVTTAILHQGVAESRPYVRARAVVGLSQVAAPSFEVATKLFKNPMASFSDRDAAMDWLVEHGGR
jgi:hypothetical protein